MAADNIKKTCRTARFSTPDFGAFRGQSNSAGHFLRILALKSEMMKKILLFFSFSDTLKNNEK